jgi:hypothetical protein
MPNTTPVNVVCREIEDRDLADVIDCLRRNFWRHSRAFWRRAFSHAASLPAAPGAPRYGRLLDAEGAIVGVLLEMRCVSSLTGAPPPRCSLSSWAVDPAFRPFALALQRRAMRDSATTYLNLTPAPHTLRANQIFGFRCYAAGAFIAYPLFARHGNSEVVAFAPDAPESAGLSQWERKMLEDHARLGLFALIGVRDSVATPFVIKMRPLWRYSVPSAQLIYTRSEADLTAFAPALGRFLWAHGRLRLLVSANGPIEGLPGRYVAGRNPRYFRGAAPPSPTDFAYTELAVL